MEITIVVSIDELEGMIKTAKKEILKDSGSNSVIIEREREDGVNFQLYHKVIAEEGEIGKGE